MKLYCEECDQLFDTRGGFGADAFPRPDSDGERWLCSDCGAELVLREHARGRDRDGNIGRRYPEDIPTDAASDRAEWDDYNE